MIDVYYKIRCLHDAGVKIILHCFDYEKSGDPLGLDERLAALEQYTEEICLYRRKTGLLSFLHRKPYIVQSRRSKGLIKRLLKDNYPIIFEGLHTCYPLTDPLLKGRLRIYRESNIEHEYYSHLALAEKSVLKKIYFLTEWIKLKRFQDVLSDSSVMLAVSEEDRNYLAEKFPLNKVIHLPKLS